MKRFLEWIDKRTEMKVVYRIMEDAAKHYRLYRIVVYADNGEIYERDMIISDPSLAKVKEIRDQMITGERSSIGFKWIEDKTLEEETDESRL